MYTKSNIKPFILLIFSCNYHKKIRLLNFTQVIYSFRVEVHCILLGLNVMSSFMNLCLENFKKYVAEDERIDSTCFYLIDTNKQLMKLK